MSKTTSGRVLVLLLWLASSMPLWALSTEEEIKLGSQASSQFEEKYGLVNDQAMVDRLNRLGGQLLRNVERKDLPWRLRVIDIDAFNAAAFPGGFLYATKGLMGGLTDEELAFVVGHEIGHVDRRHSVKQLKNAQLRRLGLSAIIAATGRKRVNKTTATLFQLTDTVIGSQRSQKDESQADRYGMRCMAQAGYDPAFALSALQKLGSQKSGGTPGFLNTLVGSHPLPRERINQGVDLITSIRFRPQVKAPVTAVPGGEEMLYRDATEALEYTLSLLGQGHRDTLQRMAEQLATGERTGLPRGVRLVRTSTEKRLGFAALEHQLLARPEFDRLGQAFGAAVVDIGEGRVEAVVLLQGGY
jgi:predicted Zn-dependent protease